MKLIIVTCEIIFREVCHCVSQSKNVVDIRSLKKGLHDLGCREMSETLQQEISQISKDNYEAIVLGYGLCNNGTVGLMADKIPLVIPRAHDCITLLLGSKQRYLKYFQAHPGTYFHSTGWLERNSLSEEDQGKDIPSQLGLNISLEECIRKYGKENAQYIIETLGQWNGLKNYDRIAYVDMGIGNFSEHEEKAKGEASERGWKFERLQGDVTLLQRLINGDWNPEEFLVVEPGQKIVPTYLADIVTAEEFH